MLREDEYIELTVFRCGRGQGDHAILFRGSFATTVKSKVSHQGRRQLSKLTYVDQQNFRRDKVTVPINWVLRGSPRLQLYYRGLTTTWRGQYKKSLTTPKLG